MDQQGIDDTPAQEAIWDATVPELARANEPSGPNSAIYTPNPWIQHQQNPIFWNNLSIFLPFFHQAGFQLPSATLQQQQQQQPALGCFKEPLLAPIEAEQPFAAGAAAAYGPVPNSLAAGPPTSPTMLTTPTKLEAPQRTARKKRARILREGQLTIIVYGANEALTWARRVAQFQNVMREVLGDRRKTFTWSGSVTDSIVGAFLTQNVSDALSSRAYMEVASRWPTKLNGLASSSYKDTSSSATNVRLSNEADTIDWEAIRTVNVNDVADAIRCRGMQTVLSTNIQSFLNHLRRYNLLKKGARVAEKGGFRGIETDVIVTVDSILDAIVEKAQLHEEREIDVVMKDLIEAVTMNTAINNSLLDIEEGIVAGSKSLSPNGLQRSSRSHISLAYEEREGVARDASKLSQATQEQQQQDKKSLEAARLLSSEWLRDVSDDEARDFLMSVNGLGRKSVACIMLLTLGRKEFPVDTNVGRICSRLGWIPLDAAESIEELDDYAPEPEVHAYLRSRLLGFDVETLYELHYQMITLGKVFCSKHSPNCTACPMQKECEYALHNGPSLHGRKRIKVAKAATQGAFGGETAAGLHEDISMVPSSPLPGSNRPPPGSKNSNKGIHWRTQQKLDRLAQEKAARELALAEHARLYSTIDLEELVYTRTTRPRSRGIRRPRGISTDGDLGLSRLQRVETELRYQAGVARWQKVYPINWLNLATLELGAQGLLPASVWDCAVDMDMGQHAEKESPEEIGNAAAAAAAADGTSLNERLGAWEEALRDAPSALHYPTRDKAANSSLDLGQDHELSIWACAGNPPPPRRLLVQQQQFEVEPSGPPVVLKSKPVVHQGGEGEGDQEAPAVLVQTTGADHHGATEITPMDNVDIVAIEFIPPEGVTEMDMRTTGVAELLPELMSWVPPPELCAPPAANAPLARKKVPGDSIQQQLEEALASTSPKNNVVLPVSPVISLLSSSSSHIELECQRLQQVAVELAAENEVLLKLDQGADGTLHRKRLLELSLQALNFDLSLSVDSAESVLAVARSNYRQLAKALHPDKCKLPGAADAFSGLAMAMRIVSEYSLEQEELEKDTVIIEESGEKPPRCDLATPAPEGSFVQQNSSLTDDTFNQLPTAPLGHRIVWNQRRLVVEAHILPAHVYSAFSHLRGASVDIGSGSDTVADEAQQVMFLPLKNIPTFQREELAGRRTMTTTTATTTTRRAKATNASDVGEEVELVINGLVNAVCEGEKEATGLEVLVDTDTAAISDSNDGGCHNGLPAAAISGQDDGLVEGMLLITCRAALRGRFPLNGTYFQINELFADFQTVNRPVKVGALSYTEINKFFCFFFVAPGFYI